MMGGGKDQNAPPLPLAGIRVLDFTTLLPGPLATLMLVDAGASVVKIESPKGGDRGRANQPRDGEESIQFALLNKGKKSLALDLKSDAGRTAVLGLAYQADVLVEQFRPGVMARLGLGYEALKARNPRLVYCSISGYGQTGPLAQAVGHDVNYVARSGMLALSVGADGHPVLPAAAAADIGGGSMPAVTNILMALLQRHASGHRHGREHAGLDATRTGAGTAWSPHAAGGAGPAHGRVATVRNLCDVRRRGAGGGPYRRAFLEALLRAHRLDSRGNG